MRALAAAHTKRDMKPSLTPCFFSNASLKLARISMAEVMSISL